MYDIYIYIYIYVYDGGSFIGEKALDLWDVNGFITNSQIMFVQNSGFRGSVHQ